MYEDEVQFKLEQLTQAGHFKSQKNLQVEVQELFVKEKE